LSDFLKISYIGWAIIDLNLNKKYTERTSSQTFFKDDKLKGTSSTLNIALLGKSKTEVSSLLTSKTICSVYKAKFIAYRISK
jgi:hypothetical protein